MCGIVGYVGRTNVERSSLRFEEAINSLKHRGPDSHGEFRHDEVWLAHLRLSILDLSKAADQPMLTDGGRFVIVYNGEVYNFQDLQSELGLTSMRSKSDTEVVMRAFEKLGVHSLPKLNGMFAFAIFDRERRRIWLVRDRLGIKPLYYQVSSEGLIFASEIKALMLLSSATPVCDMSVLHEWLYFGNALGGRTLFRGIRQLLPGHYLELEVDTFLIEVRQYWSIEKVANKTLCRAMPVRDAVAQVRHLLDAAVRRQLVADVPVGLFLSGGVDSSAIAAFASRHYHGKIATYSAGFDFAIDGGELPKAKLVAELYGTDHHEVHIASGDVATLVEKMVHHHDMPFSDAANIPLYLMSSLISHHTKVVLQGDGGDELFGGYRRYSTLKYYRFLHPLAQLFPSLSDFSSRSPLIYRLQRYIHAFAAEDLGCSMAQLLTFEDPSSNPTAVFCHDFAVEIAKADPFLRYREQQQFFSKQDIINQISLVDLTIELPDIFLEKVDRSTMAASLEVRVPFLDHDLVDFVVRLPGSMKVPYGKKKWLLKAALEGIVPNEILHGPKTGFNVPFNAWLKTSLKPLFFDHLSKFSGTHPGVLDTEHIEKLYRHNLSGTQNNSSLLWKILNFVIFANNTKIAFIPH